MNLSEMTKEELIHIITTQRITINLQSVTIDKLNEIIKLLGEENYNEIIRLK